MVIYMDNGEEITGNIVQEKAFITDVFRLVPMSIFVLVCLSVCPYHRKTPTFCGQKLIFASDDTFKKNPFQ